MYVSMNQTILLQEQYENATELKNEDFLFGTLDPVLAGTPVQLVLEEDVLMALLEIEELLDPYYFRIVFVDDKDLKSKSNIASAVYSSPRIPGTESSTVSPGTEIPTVSPGNTFTAGEIAGIVIGTLAGVAVVCVILWYFLVKRKK